MSRTISHCWSIFVLIGLLFCQGCGKDEPRATVKGQVIYRQRAGLISGLFFWPQDRREGRMIEVPCERKSEFHFDCPPGRYKITVLPPLAADGELDRTFPAEYQDPEMTPLQIEVPATGLESYTIQIP